MGIMTRGTAAVCIAAIIALLVGCAPRGAETGTWALGATPSPESTELTLLVSRLECASGVTGDVLTPIVRVESERVVITTPVADNGSDDGECPSNDEVPVTVRLDAPLGDRALIDGACLEGEAVGLLLCDPPERWLPE
jgi:hypothetical protein